MSPISLFFSSTILEYQPELGAFLHFNTAVHSFLECFVSNLRLVHVNVDLLDNSSFYPNFSIIAHSSSVS